MKIAINTRLLLPNRIEGVSRFGYEVIRRMTTRNPEIEFLFLFDRKYDERFVFSDNIRPIVIPPQSRHSILWYLWFHWSIPFALKQHQADLFFSPEFYLSPSLKIPQVPVFHDIAYEHFPEDIPAWAARYYQKYSPIYARAASHILTVSEYTKQDVSKTYEIPEEKISVAYNGASRHFHPVPLPQQQATRDRFAEGMPYFLFVGTIQPRKNIESLLKAFDQFRQQSNEQVKLVLAGRKGWSYDGALEVYENMQSKEDVLFTGYVSDEDLNALYGSALALCFVPHFEGFGIPILEAMHSETAVISANVTAMPEVAGDAAFLVPPKDIDAIARAMGCMFYDEKLRTSYIEKGRIQREKFSWDRAYEAVWKVLMGI